MKKMDVEHSGCVVAKVFTLYILLQSRTNVEHGKSMFVSKKSAESQKHN